MRDNIRKGQNENKKPKKRRSINREFAVITYAFFVLFLCLAGYFCYFIQFKSEDFINSPYNARLDQFSARTIRGDIYAADGSTVLARSELDGNNKEQRTYPQGRTYAHAVGYTVGGMAGIELEGNFNLLRSHSFFLKKLANDLQSKKNQGDSIITTLEPSLQETAYSALGDYSGAVIAIEPSTGRILCMVSKPDFDPNTVADEWESLSSDSESSILLNRCIQGLYPPGSTFKIITGLEYLKEGGDPQRGFYCDGEFTEGDTTIHCYHGIEHGDQTFVDAFGNSCNSVFAQIGLELSRKKLQSLCDKLMFNQKLPTTLKHVSKSSYTLSSKDPSSLVMRTAIGQGNTLVTPIHMAMISSAIANKGILMKPFIYDRVINDNKDIVKTVKPQEYRAIFSEKQSIALSDIMRYVVTNGTGSKLQSDSYEAYGKTGTAEFNENKDSHSWFVGFAKEPGAEENSDDEHKPKEIALAVIMEGAGSGSEHAVPLARELFDAYY